MTIRRRKKHLEFFEYHEGIIMGVFIYIEMHRSHTHHLIYHTCFEYHEAHCGIYNQENMLHIDWPLVAVWPVMQGISRISDNSLTNYRRWQTGYPLVCIWDLVYQHWSRYRKSSRQLNDVEERCFSPGGRNRPAHGWKLSKHWWTSKGSTWLSRLPPNTVSYLFLQSARNSHGIYLQHFIQCVLIITRK